MIEELKQLGLTGYEARVYETLVRLNAATGGEVSKKSKVPHGKTYESLHSLNEKGLVTILLLKPKLFKTVEPKRALQNLIDGKFEEMVELRKEITKSLVVGKEPKEKAHEKITVVGGFKKSFDISHEMFQRTKKKMYIYSTGEKVPSKLYRDIKKAIKEGIDYRFICFKFDEENKKDVKRFVDIGVNARYYPGGVMSLVVRDSEESMISVRNPKDTKDRITIHFEDPYISKMYNDYFISIWKKAKPVKF